MIYQQKVRIPQSEKIINHNIAKCIKCDCDDITLEEYEDKYGCISTAKCKKCKIEIRDNVSIVGIIKQWNKQNDIPTLIKDKSKLVNTLKNEIKFLKNKQKRKLNVG